MAKPIPMTDEEFKRFEEMANGEGPLPYSALRKACDDLKVVRGMDYPPDWWSRIMKSGLYDRIMDRVDAWDDRRGRYPRTVATERLDDYDR